MSSFKIFYHNEINRLQAFCFGVEASVEATFTRLKNASY